MRLIDADKIIYTWIVDDCGNRHDEDFYCGYAERKTE